MKKILTSDYDLLYKTNSGILLLFAHGTNKWYGPYPGKSWDDYYNDDMLNILPSECTKYPLIIIGPKLHICRPIKTHDSFHDLLISGNYEAAKSLIVADRCTNQTTNYQFCSYRCWAIQNAKPIDGLINSHS